MTGNCRQKKHSIFKLIRKTEVKNKSLMKSAERLNWVKSRSQRAGGAKANEFKFLYGYVYATWNALKALNA